MSDKDLVVFAVNALKSVRTDLSRLGEDVADMISVLSDVLAEPSVCPTCKGSGKFDNEHLGGKFYGVDCLDCHGTGEAPDEYDESVRGHRHGEEG